MSLGDYKLTSGRGKVSTYLLVHEARDLDRPHIYVFDCALYHTGSLLIRPLLPFEIQLKITSCLGHDSSDTPGRRLRH